jgi:hypothetical protein
MGEKAEDTVKKLRDMKLGKKASEEVKEKISL